VKNVGTKRKKRCSRISTSKRIDLRQTKTKMISGPFYTYSNTFHQRKLFFSW